MRNRQRQSGLTMTGFIFTAIVAVTVVMIGFRIMPSYIEYFSVQKILAKTLEDSKQGFSLYQFRRDFDLKAGADYIDSVQGSDVEVTKDGNNLVATAAWTKTLHLVGNVSLLLEFEASATK
jgi:outer membrane receptor for monomeric catechols